MSYNIWQGDSVAVAQIHKFTVQNTWEVDDTATLTCAGKSVTFTATSSGNDHVAAGLEAAWNASTEPALAEVTASTTSGGSIVHLTADTAGVSFLASSTWSTAGDGDISGPTTGTANAGPNCWDTATNWSLGTVPSSTDNVRLEKSTVDIKYGISLSSAPASLDARRSFTGDLGLPRTNADGDYVEYRTMSLTFASTGNVTTIDIGKGEGDGSRRFKLDLGTGATGGSQIINIHGSGARADPEIPPILLKGSTDSTMTINKGDVGLAFFAGETANCGTINMGYISNRDSDAKLKAGSGATLDTITKNGGQLEINSNTSGITQRAGKTTIGAGTATTINVEGGTVFYNSTGAATTINVNGGGTLDYRQSSKTGAAVTDVNLYKGAKLFDPGKTRAWDANINLLECGFNDVVMDLGEGLTISAM